MCPYVDDPTARFSRPRAECARGCRKSARSRGTRALWFAVFFLAGFAGQRAAVAQAALSIVFDDGSESDHSVALPLLREQGVVACAAIVTDWIGKPGYLDAAQILGLQAAGWEIASHTASHPNLRRAGQAALKSEYSRSIEALRSLGIEPRGLVYPYNKSSKLSREIASRYFVWARAGGSQFALARASVYDLASFSAKHDEKRVLRIIDRAAASRSWLILYLHEMTEKLFVEAARGRFKNGETVIFEPSGAKGRFIPSLWERIGESLYIVPLSGEACAGDLARGETSAATALVSRVSSDNRALLRSVIHHVRSRHPEMRIMTVSQALQEFAAEKLKP